MCVPRGFPGFKPHSQAEVRQHGREVTLQQNVFAFEVSVKTNELRQSQMGGGSVCPILLRVSTSTSRILESGPLVPPPTSSSRPLHLLRTGATQDGVQKLCGQVAEDIRHRASSCAAHSAERFYQRSPTAQDPSSNHACSTAVLAPPSLVQMLPPSVPTVLKKSAWHTQDKWKAGSITWEAGFLGIYIIWEKSKNQ